MKPEGSSNCINFARLFECCELEFGCARCGQIWLKTQRQIFVQTAKASKKKFCDARCGDGKPANLLLIEVEVRVKK